LPTALSGKKVAWGNLSYSKRKLLRKGGLERCQSCRAVPPGGKSKWVSDLGVTGRNGMPLNCTSPICRRSSLAWPARLLPSLNDRFFNSTAVRGNHRYVHCVCYTISKPGSILHSNRSRWTLAFEPCSPLAGIRSGEDSECECHCLREIGRYMIARSEHLRQLAHKCANKAAAANNPVTKARLEQERKQLLRSRNGSSCLLLRNRLRRPNAT
jgi:hypothetical protein